MKKLQNPRLYTDQVYALNMLRAQADKNIQPDHNSREKIIFHCYWYGEPGPKQVFSIKSALCTQNPAHCRIKLWLDAGSGYTFAGKSGILKEIETDIEICTFDPLAEIKGTYWDGSPGMITGNYNAAARSDAFRYLILHKYGGLYFDLDMMFLRDLGPLFSSEFCYCWEQEPYANSAMLYLRRQSPVSLYLLKKSIRQRSVLPWNILTYNDPALEELTVLPCAFFDPVWQQPLPGDAPVKSFPEFFKRFDSGFPGGPVIQSYQDFFPGCYAYHWHNQWDHPRYPDSFYGMFDREFSAGLKLRS